MEIKEEHLQRVFDEIEERAIKNAKKGVEYETIVSTAWSMRTRLLAVIRARSEEDLALKKLVGRDFVKILEVCNGDISSLRYTCGHYIVPLAIYSIVDSVKTYTEWENDVEGLCVECWAKKMGMKEKKKDQ